MTTKDYIREQKSLEGLLEECGDSFLELSIGKYKKSHSKRNLWWACRTHLDIKKSIKKRLLGKMVWRWVAGDTNEDGWQWINKGEGSTAKEAVYNLLLQIKK